MSVTGVIYVAVAVLFVIGAAVFVVRAMREERRRHEAFVETLRELSSRCPDCRGMGWHFGPPGTGDPAISTPTCQLCEGTGKLPSEETRV